MRVYQIEVTNKCKLKCSFCPKRQAWAKRKEGVINPKLLDKIDWSKTYYTELQFSGEPLEVSPLLLCSIATWLKARGIKVGFSTNGVDTERLQFVEEFVDIITVNSDKFRIPPGIDSEKIYVQKLGKTFPIEDYTHKKKYPHPIDCVTPLYYVSIQWDGDVVPCCHAHGKQVVYGNLYKSSWNEVVNSTVAKNFISSMRNKKGNKLCEYCQSPNPHMIHKKLCAEVLHATYPSY